MNNPKISGQELYDQLARGDCSYFAFQLEKGEQGTPHFQGCFGFLTMRNLAAMRKKYPMHIEITRNAMASWDYCQKEDTRLEGPWHHGAPPAKLNTKGDKAARNKYIAEVGAAKACEEGLIDVTQYAKAKASINQYIEDKRKVDSLTVLDNQWHYGDPGTGKTLHCIQTWPDYYEKDKTKYWNGYNEQETVLIDDIEQDEKFMLGMLKKIAQHKPFVAEDKYGGLRLIRPKRILVTSNYHPNEIWEKKEFKALDRRFKYHHHAQLPASQTGEFEG